MDAQTISSQLRSHCTSSSSRWVRLMCGCIGLAVVCAYGCGGCRKQTFVRALLRLWFVAILVRFMDAKVDVDTAGIAAVSTSARLRFQSQRCTPLPATFSRNLDGDRIDGGVNLLGAAEDPETNASNHTDRTRHEEKLVPGLAAQIFVNTANTNSRQELMHRMDSGKTTKHSVGR